MSPKNKGYLYMTGFSFFTAISYLVVEWSYEKFLLTPDNVMFWGMLGGTLLATPFFFTRAKERSALTNCACHNLAAIMLVGLAVFVGGTLWFWGMAQSNAGMIALLAKSESIWALFLGVLFLQERFTSRESAGIVLAVIGVILVSTIHTEATPLVVGAILLSSFFYALQGVIIKKLTLNLDGAAFAFLRGCALVIFTGLFFGVLGKIDWPGWLPFLFLALSQLGSLVLARALFFEAHRYLEISKLNIFHLLTPVWVLAGGLFLFPEHELGAKKIVGAFLILSGIFLISRGEISRPKLTKAD